MSGEYRESITRSLPRTTTVSDNIGAALVAALAEMPNIRKTGTGNYGKHAELSEITETVRPILAKYGLGVMQEVVPLDGGHLGIVTKFVHTSGESLNVGPLPMPAPNDPQKVGSSISYGRRYALMAALNLAAEDDDGQAAKPAPEPTYSKAALDLNKACRALTGETRDKFRDFAVERGGVVSPEAFETDKQWAEAVRQFLKEHSK
jgi:hypothetical protein